MNPTCTCTSSDTFVFLRAWLRNPLRVASAIPSGRSLGQLITQEIDPACGRVIELGPGTGVFTRALIGRGVAESDLVLIEKGREFTGMLAERFPQAAIVESDAAKIGQLELGGPAGAVVSGLPLLSMPPRQVMSILAGAFRHLGNQGKFYQFTYGPRCPVPRPILDRLGLKAVLVGRTIQNFPPAAVYRISRRNPLAFWQRNAD
ncbi:class I SAM-dependent methyltransferase [Rhizobium sp. 21-4511-3d]